MKGAIKKLLVIISSFLALCVCMISIFAGYRYHPTEPDHAPMTFWIYCFVFSLMILFPIFAKITTENIFVRFVDSHVVKQTCEIIRLTGFVLLSSGAGFIAISSRYAEIDNYWNVDLVAIAIISFIVGIYIFRVKK